MKSSHENKPASIPHGNKPFFGKSKKENFFSKTTAPQKSFFAPATIPTSLKVGQPNDSFEKEADAKAEEVVSKKEEKAPIGKASPSIQRTGQKIIQKLAAHKSPALDDAKMVNEEENTETVQPLLQSQQKAPVPFISKKELANTGNGKKLDHALQANMETQFGADFSNVKIHHDTRAAKMASSINARAFTHGSNIYFNKGEYNPSAKEGKKTLAHELTHVVQQGGTKNASSTPNIQKLGDLGTQLASGVAPWGPSGPVGTNYEVSTDAGTKVKAWVAYSPYKIQFHYWCHGHSLGTFNKYGYSVYSGAGMKAVIKDEWVNINPVGTKAGDIAVWTSRWDHSAVFVNPVIAQGSLDPTASVLSTKNGQSPLATMTLNQIAGIYGSAGIAIYRHK